MQRKIDSLAPVLYGKYETWKTARQELEDKWAAYYRVYRCYETAEDRTRESERSQIKMPATREAVNIFVDAAMAVTFNSEPFFALEPRSVASEARAALLRRYISYLFQTENIYTIIEQFYTNLGLYGTAILKVEPSIKIDRTFARASAADLPDNENMAERGEMFKISQTKRVRPKTMNVPIEDFYIDPVATDIQSADGVCVRSMVPAHVLREMAANGQIDKAAVDSILAPAPADPGAVPELPSATEVVSDFKRDQLTQAGIQIEDDIDRIEVLDFWCWCNEADLRAAGYDGEIENGGAEVHCIILNTDTIGKLVPNPFLNNQRPFLSDCYEHLPGEFYGLGIAEVATGPQRALDATVRSRLDNKAMSINQLFAINARKLIAGQSLKLYPGKAFLFDGPPGENFYPIAVPDVTNGSYQEAAEYERYAQSATGITRLLGGMPTKAGEQTAHEIQTLMNQANSRVMRIVTSFEHNVMEPLLRWYYTILYQTFNVKEAFRITNNQTGVTSVIEITPSDIEGDYDFQPLGSTSMAKLGKLNKYLQLLQITANPLDAQAINRTAVLRKAAETMGLNDIDDLFAPPPQQIAAAQQQGPQGSQPAIQPGGVPTLGPTVEPAMDAAGPIPQGGSEQ